MENPSPSGLSTKENESVLLSKIEQMKKELTKYRETEKHSYVYKLLETFNSILTNANYDIYYKGTIRDTKVASQLQKRLKI